MTDEIQPQNRTLPSNPSPTTAQSQNYMRMGQELIQSLTNVLKNLATLKNNPESVNNPQFLLSMKDSILRLQKSSSEANKV